MSSKQSKSLNLTMKDRKTDYLSKFVIFITLNNNNIKTRTIKKYPSFNNTKLKFIIIIIYYIYNNNCL